MSHKTQAALKVELKWELNGLVHDDAVSRVVMSFHQCSQTHDVGSHNLNMYTDWEQSYTLEHQLKYS